MNIYWLECTLSQALYLQSKTILDDESKPPAVRARGHQLHSLHIVSQNSRSVTLVILSTALRGQFAENSNAARAGCYCANMYALAKGIKQDPIRRWSLPDRVFFACGACHILAYAFLTRYPDAGFKPIWIKPAEGYTGNHVAVVKEDQVFDYHGHSSWSRLLEHTNRKASRWWPGWSAELVELPPDVLVSEAKSREYEGLWLREPGQFLHDAMPRAVEFLKRFPAP